MICFIVLTLFASSLKDRSPIYINVDRVETYVDYTLITENQTLHVRESAAEITRKIESCKKKE